MPRIHVTGNAGSGKTSLAAALGDALELPVFGLDNIVWGPGWEKIPASIRGPKERALVSKQHWIIEGVSPIVREAADTIIFLDVGRPTCFFRCLKRNWRYLFKSRPGLPENCPEILIIPKLIKIVWRFPRRMRPTILADLSTGGQRVLIARNSQELSAAFVTLKADL
jgi:adenylate kinase family enzyme